MKLAIAVLPFKGGGYSSDYGLFGGAYRKFRNVRAFLVCNNIKNVGLAGRVGNDGWF